MVATNAPKGLTPVRNLVGTLRPTLFTNAIASAYGTALYKGTPIKIVNGKINIAASTGAFDGIFLGVRYVDSVGRPVIQNNWVASTTLYANTTADAEIYWVTEGTEWEIQADGSVTQAGWGLQYNFTNITAGNATTGISGATMSATSIGTGTAAQMVVSDISATPNNAWGDSFTVVRVKLNLNQLGPGSVTSL